MGTKVATKEKISSFQVAELMNAVLKQLPQKNDWGETSTLAQLIQVYIILKTFTENIT